MCTYMYIASKAYKSSKLPWNIFLAKLLYTSICLKEEKKTLKLKWQKQMFERKHNFDINNEILNHMPKVALMRIHLLLLLIWMS